MLDLIIKVRVMDAPDGTGPAIDVREFMLDEFWHRVREAQARSALMGRKIKGPMRPQQYMGPLRRGWWLQPHTAEELARDVDARRRGGTGDQDKRG